MSKFVIDTTHDIINLFRNITENLHKHNIKAECVLDGYITVTSKKSEDEVLKNVLAETAEEFITDSIEYEKICKILKDFELTGSEINTIYKKIRNDRNFCENRRRILIHCFKNHMKSSNNLNIDGLVNFRFRDYSDALILAAEDGLEQYMTDKAYKEFLDLLKYFVSIQTGDVLCANVYGSSDFGYLITDETGNIIEGEQYDDFFSEMNICDLMHDDILLSRLISISPPEIIMHTDGNGKICETLRYIFGEKIKFSNTVRNGH